MLNNVKQPSVELNKKKKKAIHGAFLETKTFGEGVYSVCLFGFCNLTGLSEKKELEI